MVDTVRNSKKSQAGFAVSSEFLLIAVILVAGLVSGWVHFRDSSLSEIKDSIAALDSYVTGASSTFLPYQQLYISSAGLVDDEVTPVVINEASFSPECKATETGIVCGTAGTPFATGSVNVKYGTRPTAATDTSASEVNVF